MKQGVRVTSSWSVREGESVRQREPVRKELGAGDGDGVVGGGERRGGRGARSLFLACARLEARGHRFRLHRRRLAGAGAAALLRGSSSHRTVVFLRSLE